MRNAYEIFVGKPEGKGPLGIAELRWEDNIRMDLRETGWDRCGLYARDSGCGPMAGCYENGNEPSDYIKGGEFLD
jgi:hypothetical protein